MIDLARLKSLLDAATPYAGYFVTADGNIISTIPWRGSSCHVLTPHPNSHGYLRVHVVTGGKRASVFVHKLVAACFLPPRPSPRHELRHLDGDKANNCAANLAWGTRKDNADDRARHGRTAAGVRNGCAKLTDDAVREIRQGGAKTTELAEKYGVDPSRIRRIRKGTDWKHVQGAPR